MALYQAQFLSSRRMYKEGLKLVSSFRKNKAKVELSAVFHCLKRGFIEKTGTDSSQRDTEKGQETMGS